MTNNPIFVISDLHLGNCGPRDNFNIDNKREEKLLKFLDYVDDNNGELFILGDLFEFWQTNMGRIFTKRIKILDRLSLMKTKYIIGNHDCDLMPLIGSNFFIHPFFKSMTNPFIVYINGKEIKFLHGHEYDPFNSSEDPNWGDILTVFAAMQEDKNGSPMLPNGTLMEDYLNNFGEKALGIWNRFYNIYILVKNLFNRDSKLGSSPDPQTQLNNKSNRLSQHLRNLKLNKKAEGYDMVICGHTHVAGKFEDWYYNSGSWVWVNNEFIKINPDGRILNYLWTNSGEKEVFPIITA
jgi:UDP-2,3-diacylglucosamine pyrophosphatase LpxH